MIRNKKGQGGIGLVAAVTMMVVGIVFILIGIFIGQEIMSTVNASLLGQTTAGAANAAAFCTSNATPGMLAAWGAYGSAQSGFTLAGISLIVIGAVVVISLLRSAF